uniref:Uncharacterized protein n=1 Tax=Anguilla anguilla TaxID=7936 RepID=A0A0E9R6Q3_ANGAN
MFRFPWTPKASVADSF